LRIVSKRIQGINTKINKNNKTGITGVSFDEINKRWIARWRDENSKDTRESFSESVYGEEGARQLAIDRRKKAEYDLEDYRKALEPELVFEED
jgi:hypothetical protein